MAVLCAVDGGVAAAHRRQQSVRRGHAGLLGLVHMTGVEAHGMHAPSILLTQQPQPCSSSLENTVAVIADFSSKNYKAFLPTNSIKYDSILSKLSKDRLELLSVLTSKLNCLFLHYKKSICKLS